MKQEKCRIGKVSLMGHGAIVGKIKHVNQFGMDFVEVITPIYDIISESFNPKKKEYDSKVEFERFYKLVGEESAGMYSYNAIYSIQVDGISEFPQTKHIIESDWAEASPDDLPF